MQNANSKTMKYSFLSSSRKRGSSVYYVNLDPRFREDDNLETFHNLSAYFKYRCLFITCSSKLLEKIVSPVSDLLKK